MQVLPLIVRMSGPQIERSLAATHVRHLDGIRGLAVLAVFLFHGGSEYVMATNSEDHPLLHLMMLGWAGVDMFFVLSGFLITQVLLAAQDDPHRWRNFYARRCLRIWPVYLAFLAATLWLAPAAMAHPPADLVNTAQRQIWFWSHASNWLFYMNGGFKGLSLGHTWSLAIEEQFYLLWPLVVWCAPRSLLAPACAGLLAASVAARAGMLIGGHAAPAVYVNAFAHLDGLALGSWLGAYRHGHGGLKRLSGALPAFCLAGVGLLAAALAIEGTWAFWRRADTALVPLAASLLTVALLVGAELRPGLAAGLGSWPLVKLGEVSYAFYLLHPIVVHFVFPGVYARSTQRGAAVLIAQFVVAGLASYALSLASWQVIERHALRLKLRFERG